MSERMLCLDICLNGKDLGKSERIRQKVAIRKPKNGRLYYRDEDRWSNLKGGEGKVLMQIAEQRLNGEIYDIDGIFEGGINIAARVSDEEAEKLRQDQSCSIIAELGLSESRMLSSDSSWIR